MSVLRNRIVSQTYLQGADGYTHPAPAGLPATPNVMPLALVDYGGAGARYQDLHVIPATGDVNAVPFYVVAPGSFGTVVPAGRI